MQISAGGALPVTLYGHLIGYRWKVVPLLRSVVLSALCPLLLPRSAIFPMKIGRFLIIDYYCITLAILRILCIMSVPSVDLEMQSPAHPPPTAIEGDEEERQKCWRDVEAETGFRSYRSFLEALPDTGPRYKNLLSKIRKLDDFYTFHEVHVLTILEDGDMSISMDFQGRSEHLEVDKHCTQLLRNLRSPPKNSLARIIVWLIPRSSRFLPLGLVDAIGLSLKIEPAIFANLLSSCRRLGPDYVVIGNSIATVAQNYIPNERVPPVLFVAKVDHGMTDFSSPTFALDEEHDSMVIEALTTELHGSITPCRTAKDMRSLESLAPNSSGYLDRLSNHVLLSILSKYVQKGAGVDAQNNGPLLNALVPLLHLEVFYLHAQCEITRRALLIAQSHSVEDLGAVKQSSHDTLDRQRFGLRRKLEELKESRSHFVKFARSQNAPDWLKEQPWLSQEEEIIEMVTKARVVEAETRDYMQLQIGNLSIEESKKSIQLSNQQMSEAKRGKSCKYPSPLMPLLINSQLRYVSGCSLLYHQSY